MPPERRDVLKLGAATAAGALIGIIATASALAESPPLSDVRTAKLTHHYHQLTNTTDPAATLTWDHYQTLITNTTWIAHLDPTSPPVTHLTDTLKTLYNTLTTNNPNPVTLNTFLAAIASGTYTATLNDVAAAWFNALDTDNDNHWKPLDYAALTWALGLNDTTTLHIMFNHLDTDHDGHITETQLTAALRGFYLDDDPQSFNNLFFGPVPGLAPPTP